MKKQIIQEILDQLPDEIDASEFIDRIFIGAKLEKAEEAIRNGDVISQEDFEKETEKWFE